MKNLVIDNAIRDTIALSQLAIFQDLFNRVVTAEKRFKN